MPVSAILPLSSAIFSNSGDIYIYIIHTTQNTVNMFIICKCLFGLNPTVTLLFYFYTIFIYFLYIFILRICITMFLVVFVFVYVHWKLQYQEKFLVGASTLGNKALSDSDSDSDNLVYMTVGFIIH